MRTWPHMRSRPVAVLLVGLTLTLLVSGCGGASPETRARQTKTALHATSTPTLLRAARTPIAREPVFAIDQERTALRTAEARLPIATEGAVGSCVARAEGEAETPRPSPHSFRNSLVVPATPEPERVQRTTNPSGGND